jgi:dihydropteroate synthase
MEPHDKYIEFFSHGKLIQMDNPSIMGIVNVTPDSFFTQSRVFGEEMKNRIQEWIQLGCDILDIGGQSTRPGAERIDAQEEWARVEPALRFIREHFPQQILSIDTFYSSVAENAMQLGVHIINDVSAGQIDSRLWEVVKKWQVPYVLMHMKGEPQTMQVHPQYDDVVNEVATFFEEKLKQLQEDNNQIWLDPGFGFGKTHEHNLQLLSKLKDFQKWKKPILVGLSRKKTIQFLTETDASGCLPGTLAAQTIALMNGASILRVHDVSEAIQLKKVWSGYQKFQ